MIDLTPLDVRKKRGDFRKILRGYDPEEVDTFMDLVAERFEELVRDNLALTEKTGRIENQLGALMGREQAVQEALVTAQKLREDVRIQTHRDAEVLQAQASREVELLKAEAEAEVARRLGEAQGLILERQRALEEMERSRLKFLKSFRGLLERELDSIEVEESRRPLDDTPLELDLRGWMPDGGSEAEGVEEEEEGVEEEEEEEAEEIEEVESEADEDLPDGFETQILEAVAPAGLSVIPEEDPWQGSEMESEADLIGELEEEGLTPSSREPKWLFSFLKKEEEERGEEG